MINPLNSYPLILLSVRYSILYFLHSHLLYIFCFNRVKILLCQPYTRRNVPTLPTLPITVNFTDFLMMLFIKHLSSIKISDENLDF